MKVVGKGTGRCGDGWKIIDQKINCQCQADVKRENKSLGSVLVGKVLLHGDIWNWGDGLCMSWLSQGFGGVRKVTRPGRQAHPTQ